MVEDLEDRHLLPHALLFLLDLFLRNDLLRDVHFVAAATEDTPVAEGEGFNGVRSVEKIVVGRVMSRATIQCDDGLG